MARTTAQWWDDVSTNDDLFIDWLKKQYHGERTAAMRIAHMCSLIPMFDGKYEWRARILSAIVHDESKHAKWVGELLHTRNIKPEMLEKDERYWKEVLPTMGDKTFEYLCAIGHLAEVMRLERIKLLASDSRFTDVAEVFSKILPEEEFHAALFGIMSTPEDIAEATKYHLNGMNALGLEP